MKKKMPVESEGRMIFNCFISPRFLISYAVVIIIIFLLFVSRFSLCRYCFRAIVRTVKIINLRTFYFYFFKLNFLRIHLNQIPRSSTSPSENQHNFRCWISEVFWYIFVTHSAITRVTHIIIRFKHLNSLSFMYVTFFER